LKGIDVSVFDRKAGSFQDVLLWGMLAGGIGLGLFIGYSLFQARVFNDDSIEGILAVLIGGISLVFYFIVKRMIDKKIACTSRKLLPVTPPNFRTLSKSTRIWLFLLHTVS
jgi:hypothetical protein